MATSERIRKERRKRLPAWCRFLIVCIVGYTLLVAIKSGERALFSSDYQKGKMLIYAVESVQRYRDAYGRSPTLGLTEAVHDLKVLERESRLVFQNLGGFDQENNPRRTIYFELPQSGVCGETDPKQGVFHDPWCEQYLIRFDDDGDGFVTFGDKQIKAPVVVWSKGKNKQNEWSAGDDLVSVRLADH